MHTDFLAVFGPVRQQEANLVPKVASPWLRSEAPAQRRQCLTLGAFRPSMRGLSMALLY